LSLGLQQAQSPGKVENFLRGFTAKVVGAEFFIIGERYDGVCYKIGKDM
jgi:hypothetical protein